MAEVGRKVEEYVKDITDKLKKGALPPDPVRIVVFALSTVPSVEHALILPPLVETVHSQGTEPMAEKLPRLPLTGDFPIRKWKEYKVE